MAKKPPKIELIRKNKIIEIIENEDVDDTDTGTGTSGTGASGTGEPIIDPSIFGLVNHHLMEQLRENERKFGGRVPITHPPREKSSGPGQGPKRHPMFEDTQELSGIFDNKNNPSAAQNKEASKEFAEHAYENKLTPAPKRRNIPEYRR